MVNMKKKKKTASISPEATKILEQLLAENFPGKNVQIGRGITHDLLMGGTHTMAMVREQFAHQAEKVRQAEKGYREKAKAKKGVDTFVGEMSTWPEKTLRQMKTLIERAEGDKKQTAILKF